VAALALQSRPAMRFSILVSVVTTFACTYGPPAYNALIGPTFGVRLGGPPGPREVLGIEGGVGAAPHRLNLGFRRRVGLSSLYYFELDPWFFLGGSLGFGIERDDAGSERAQPVLGVWEGLAFPLTQTPNCLDVPVDHHYYPTISVSVGYRYTGIHEIYFAPKFGYVQMPEGCD
jgi:hypothetical protein